MSYHKAGILYHPREAAAQGLARLLAETVLRPLAPWLAQTGDLETCEREGADTDTMHDFEYTDWAAVEHFAHDVAARVQDAGARDAG